MNECMIWNDFFIFLMLLANQVVGFFYKEYGDKHLRKKKIKLSKLSKRLNYLKLQVASGYQIYLWKLYS